MKGDVQQGKANLKADDAESRAEWAETDAMLAIDYAYAAIEEAEYQTLDAILTRREAQDLAVGGGGRLRTLSASPGQYLGRAAQGLAKPYAHPPAITSWLATVASTSATETSTFRLRLVAPRQEPRHVDSYRR